MKKIIPLLLLVCLLWGCTPGEPAATAAPVPETTVPVTEPATEVFVEEEVVLEAVNKHSFNKSGESPTVAAISAAFFMVVSPMPRFGSFIILRRRISS